MLGLTVQMEHIYDQGHKVDHVGRKLFQNVRVNVKSFFTLKDTNYKLIFIGS
jgi:hypothetical protein